MVNAEAFGQVHRQQRELEHRLESQRRLLEVNERLLATLDQSGVLEMIADCLKAVVTYDSLTIYRVDRAAWVRRAVVSRDRFAELILQHEAAARRRDHRLGDPQRARRSSPTTRTSTRDRCRSRARPRSRSR